MTSRASLCASLGASAAAAAALLIVPATATACGGFFCNNLAPVNQSGESILFAVEDGMVEAHVQVVYSGPSESFAWIIPTPSRPEVGVGHAYPFTRMRALMGSQTSIASTVDGTCYQFPYCPSEDAGWGTADAASGDAFADAGGGGGVTVLEQSQTGPYDYVILQSSSVEPLFEWLAANDYDIPEVTMPFVEPYVLMEDDVHFVAFKLSKNRDTGDIVPVVLRYASAEPMIPIQLTAIASTPTLPIYAYFLGDARAVPENYVHAVVSDVARGWSVAGASWEEVVRRAVDEAGGQAFVTEFAGDASVAAGGIYTEDRFSLGRLAEITDPTSLLQSLAFWLQVTGLGLDSTVVGILDEFFVADADFIASIGGWGQYFACPSCWGSPLTTVEVDAAALVARIRSDVLDPIEHVQDLFDTLPYATHLMTVMTPANMTQDPYFTFNADLPDVDNVHRGLATRLCGRGRAPWLAPTRLNITEGRELWLPPTERQFDPDANLSRTLPVLERVEETGSSGPTMVVRSNSAAIDAAVAEWNARWMVYDVDPTVPPGPVGCDDDSSDAGETDVGAGEDAADGTGGEGGGGGGGGWSPVQGEWVFDDAAGVWRYVGPSEADRSGEPSRGCVAGARDSGASPLWFGAVALVAVVARRRRAR